MRNRPNRFGVTVAVSVMAVAILVEIVGQAVTGSAGDPVRVAVGVSVMLLAVGLITVVLRFGQGATRRRLQESEDSLASFENLYERMLALARDIFILADPAGRIIEANAAAVEAYGYSREELLRMHVRDLRGPEARTALEDEWQAAARPEGALVETVHMRRDGSTFPVEISSLAVDVDGVPVRQSFVRDTSRRKANEADLRRLNTAYATLAATNEAIVHSPDRESLFAGICRAAVEQGRYLGAWVGLADVPSGRIVAIASAGSIDEYIRGLAIDTDPAARDAGRPAAIALRDGWPSYSEVLADDLSIGAWAQLAGRFGIAAAVALPLLAAGSPTYVFSLYSDDPHVFDGEMRRLLEGMASDISFALVGFDRQAARTQAEGDLRESEARYRALAEGSPLAIFVNREDKVVLANAACGKLFGAATPGDLIGRTALELFEPASRALVRERIRVDSETVPLVEVRIVRLDGTAVDVEATASPLLDQGIKAIQVLLRDITERKAAQAEILQLNAGLEERVAERTARLELANKELESLSYSVSHDLRAPLRAITGFASILARRHREGLDERGRHYVDTIVESGNHMSVLIDELLAYSRMGRRTVRAEPVPLGPIVAALRTTFGARMESTGATLEVVEPLAMPLGDSVLLERIVLNLIDNALTYRRADVAPLIRVSATRHNGTVTLAVADNGIGIPVEYREKVFEVFARLHADEEYPGTGIGLSVVRKAARLMGSDIILESTVGSGSTFRLDLPAEKQGSIAS